MFLLLVVVLVGQSASVAVPSACGKSDGSGKEYWLEKRCYDLSNESEEIKQEMYSICPVLRQQNLTFFPNLFNHSEPQHALDILRQLRGIINQSCDHHLNDFICHLYFPPCIDDICLLIQMYPESNILNPLLVYPCQSMCDLVTKNCEALFSRLREVGPGSIGLLKHFQCMKYAKEETGMCIRPVKRHVRAPKKPDGGKVDRFRRLIGKLKHFVLFTSDTYCHLLAY